MLKVKLQQRGKKHQRTYRIIIGESRSKVQGRCIDDLGYYLPQLKKLEIDRQKLTDWVKRGAQLTLGVNRLLEPEKYPKKPKKVKKPATT